MIVDIETGSGERRYCVEIFSVSSFPVTRNNGFFDPRNHRVPVDVSVHTFTTSSVSLVVLPSPLSVLQN